jgi:hypothetical protein
MSSMLENFTNPSNKDQLEERMARIKEDPSLKHILDEIETGGPAAMMRSKYQFFKIIFYCSGISIFPP